MHSFDVILLIVKLGLKLNMNFYKFSSEQHTFSIST